MARSSSRTPLLHPTEQVKMNLPPFDTGKWNSTETKRIGVFLLSIMVGLASGSNYVYSAYAPQLASQLVLSSTQVNLVGTAGNLGMYLTGPLYGLLHASYLRHTDKLLL